jgi:hypothetical protein
MINPIPVNFETEMAELSNKLKKAAGYLACEKIILQHIKKHTDNDCDDINIEKHLKKVAAHIDGMITANQDRIDCTNYRYAGGFLNILLRTPRWKNWVKTIEP